MQGVDLTKFDIFQPASWVDFINSQFIHNDVFTGVATMSIIGGLVYLLRNSYKHVFNGIKNLLIVELVIESSDPIYGYVKEWMGKTNYAKKHCRRLTLATNVIRDDEDCIDYRAVKRSYNLSPNHGIHLFFFKGRPLLVRRELVDSKDMSYSTQTRREQLTLSYMGRSRKLLYDFIDTLNAERGDQNKSVILSGTGRGWEFVCTRKVRTLDTIFLPQTQKDKIIRDIEWFTENQKWYDNRGLPYHRGYMFSGPAGTGKTSTIRAICGHFELNMGILNINAIGSDRDLINIVAQIPANTAIIIEDIDTIGVAASRVKKRDEGDMPDSSDEWAGGVTLSGLLNALDGITTPDKLLVFMTTNHPENLDAALMRAGRVDLHEHFGYPDEEVVKAMFNAYYPEKTDRAHDFYVRVRDKNYPTAELQNMFFVNHNFEKLMESI